MGVFEFKNGNELTADQIEEILVMVKVREPDRLDELPDNYEVITQDMLGYSSSQEGRMDAQGYYHAGSPAQGGQAIAILEDDGTISISFRGTNDRSDLFSINNFSGNRYINGFDEWLTSVANFAEENNYSIEYVTGKSLGGACVNMLRDESDQIAGGAYADAKYFAVASPLISDNDNNIINYGHDNDYAFEWYEERFGDGDIDQPTATDNIVYYNSKYHSSSWRSFLDFSAHSYNSIENGMDAIARSKFSEEMEQDDLIVIADNKHVKAERAYDRVDANADDVYILGANNKSMKIDGTDKNDHIELQGGNDTVRAGNGDDIIYSGAGRNRLYGQNGDDTIHGGNWHDTIKGGRDDDLVFANSGHDNIKGDNGDDIIYGGWGRDTIHGGKDDDTLYGDQHSDTIRGSLGNDHIDGGRDNDRLSGGAGDDVFYIDSHGHDRITDFKIGEDKLGYREAPEGETQFNYAEDYLSATDTRYGVQIKFSDDNSILLKGRTIEELEQAAEEEGEEKWEDLVFELI